MTVDHQTTVERRRIRVTGVVQGVGFRPFVHNQAVRLGVSGHVGNDADGVFIEAEGESGAIEALCELLRLSPPPLAVVESVEQISIPVEGDPGFRIVESLDSGGRTLVSPDLRTCDACLSEVDDPRDRRHRYPFTNCTDCGPRYTIIRALPYDRPLTTMDAFRMCERCRVEYQDPFDRRFHAQPNACPECGPALRLETPGGEALPGDPIEVTRRMVSEGRIVAVKGLGGFHLACDATSDRAVAELRLRKGRNDKPFAVMVADLDMVHVIARLGAEEQRLIESRRRPIVLVDAKPETPVSDRVAPGNRLVGVMLPYTPLHHLLIQPGEVWVMTSANLSQEPIVNDNHEAHQRLASLADALLLHDRQIVVPADDSVVRVVDGEEMPIRRSRGYAPFPVRLPVEVPPLLAVGAELKATFCLASGRDAFMSQHIGDMENVETLRVFERVVEHMQSLFGIEPELIAADLHPRYLSSRWAEEHAVGRQFIRVQHHHAHLASLLAEHGETGRIIGFSFDGTGYGSDGSVWGGEVMVADLAEYERVGHLAPVLLPGGDAAVRRPYRMALSHLAAAGIQWDADLAPVAACPETERKVLARQLERRINSVATSSAGRLFDAAASLAGVRHEVGYEGQAAIEFESLIDPDESGEYPFAVALSDPILIDPAPVWPEMVADLRDRESVGAVSARFHRGLAAAMVDVAVALRRERRIDSVGCSGGVFQNAALVRLVTAKMKQVGFRVLMHRLVPPNDGGLALGQAVVAAAARR